jgi:hypothetical protein
VLHIPHFAVQVPSGVVSYGVAREMAAR